MTIIMLWAAFYLGFFCFLGAGKFTYPSWKAFNPTMLFPSDIAVDPHQSPTHMAVNLKASKTDPFGAGTYLYLGATGSAQCN